MRIRSVIPTRTDEENRRIAPLLAGHGLAVHPAPLIELRPLSQDACGLRSVRRIAGGEPVLLTSPFATDLWLDLRETTFREHAPRGYYIVGRRSAELVREADPDVPVLALADSGAGLLELPLDGVDQLLYPCSTERRDELVDGLRARGIDVIDLPLYTPALPSGAAARLRQALAEAEPPTALLFYSPSAVANFVSLRPEIGSGRIFAAIGRTTADALRAAGFEPAIVPERPGTAEVIASLLAHDA